MVIKIKDKAYDNIYNDEISYLNKNLNDVGKTTMRLSNSVSILKMSISELGTKLNNFMYISVLLAVLVVLCLLYYNLERNYMSSRVEILYHTEKYPDLEPATTYGNFIDLRSAERYEIKKGDFTLINLGVSMKLPDGYWGQVVPRSSLFKTHGLIETNSFGVIDNDYCGENDIWMLPVYATKDTVIEANERVCQFRIVKDNDIELVTVDKLDYKDRGGFGSTGTD